MRTRISLAAKDKLVAAVIAITVPTKLPIMQCTTKAIDSQSIVQKLSNVEMLMESRV